MLASIGTHAATLVTPLVIGTAIDAVFTCESEYALPLVPQTWLPTEAAAQFWRSTGLAGTALLLSALLAWVCGVAMNFFAHGVMFGIRTDADEKIQRLDMTFFDNKETGEK
nr:ABC transporter transmembrane domain-containing protein [Halorientalis brevis]